MILYVQNNGLAIYRLGIVLFFYSCPCGFIFLAAIFFNILIRILYCFINLIY